ncbi:MAG TPA: type III-B CRISPR module-associated protein Cmr3 [Thermoanaerobaculia bacterium]|jgi:CRISPR-associated protein Cmr3|nr:type III-B CRISPR module-associated protein Cmr3 [Thermoanaerobaculia bacterium]
MSVWLIEPLDPLIARDGRPAAVGRFTTTGFPYPSMVAGAVRTRMGSENGAFTLEGDALKELTKKVHVRGPLLAELSPDDGTVDQWLAPAPRDAVFLEEKGVIARRCLAPRPLDAGQSLDSLVEKGLLPLGFQGDSVHGKPPKDIPSFWSWCTFASWLSAPKDQTGVDLSSLGTKPLPVETRVHLALQSGERVGIDGMLFQTSGLRFLQEGKTRLAPRRFALSLQCQGATVAGRSLELHEQTAPLGGERRLARWSPASENWPEMPGNMKETIVATRHARLILLTPAMFKNGSLPAWNDQDWPLGGPIKAKVRAAAVPRPEVVSGWDLAADNGPDKPKGRPKPTRRLAAAGSVYFLDLEGGTVQDVERWCEDTWLACVSDDEQSRRDGFGLAVLGVWEEKTL